MPNYTITGRVVSPNGSPVSGASVQAYERTGLGADTVKGSATSTDTAGNFTAAWTESVAVTPPWDVFVTVSSGGDTVNSRLISDLKSETSVDLILGSGTYQGRTEWDRMVASVGAVVTSTLIKAAVGANTIELSRQPR